MYAVWHMEAGMLVTIETKSGTPSTPEVTTDEAHAAARAVVNLFDRWGLADMEARELLGGMSQRTWARLKKGEAVTIDRDCATRLSILLGIHKGTRYLFNRDAKRAYRWIKAPNGAFGGRSALDVMMGGQMMDLYTVRRYLDAERSGW